MRQAAAFAVVLLAVAAACTTQGNGVEPSPSPALDPDVELPGDAEPFIDDPAVVVAVDAGDREPLVPEASSFQSFPDGTWEPLEQIVVAWFDGVPGARRVGVVVWQRFDDDPTWRAVYAFSDPRREGLYGVRTWAGDVTGDRIPDVLSFEDRGGSGGCGTYRVIEALRGDATEIFRRDVCDTEVRIARGDLEVRAAVYEPDDAHCCPSAFRTTTLRWDGERWDRVASHLQPTAPA